MKKIIATLFFQNRSLCVSELRFFEPSSWGVNMPIPKYKEPIASASLG